MCGITGIYNLSGHAVSAGLIESMCNKIKHRGPDDEGYAFIDTSKNQCQFASGQDTYQALQNSLIPLSQTKEANLGLGFRRLSIQDISVKGHQPMTDVSESLVIVFNGEIYNFLEIREVLEGKNYQFRSRTDTEVILNAYLEWGEKCVEYFNGMWAFVIWDKRTKKLFCSRDRFGIKPFYYAHMRENFVFGSEIKALLEVMPAETNENAVFKYLYFDEKDSSDETFFNNIFQLNPGHNMIVSEMEPVNIYSYYTVSEAKEELSYEQAQEKFKKLFEQAVKLRLRSDVPLGYALSGGLDSSAIVAMAHKLGPVNQNTTFSIVYPGESIDESVYVDEVLHQTKFDNSRTTPSAQDLEEEMSNFLYCLEEPIPNLSYFNDFILRKLVKKNQITVTLEGQGADEILAGYRSFVLPYLFDLLDQRRFKKFIIDKNHFQGLYKTTYRNIFIRYIVSKFPDYFNIRLKQLFNQSSKHLYKSAYFKKHVIKNKRSKTRKGNLDSALYNALNFLSIPKLLTRGDKISMAYSLESRFPFLDHRLIDFTFQLPINFKIGEGLTKKVMRDALQSIIPEKILERRDKIGFISPQTRWINEMETYFDAIVYSDEFKKFPYINWVIFEKKYQKIKHYPEEEANEIWKIIGLYLWQERFIEIK
ncbi:MAG: asparagine synthase (glutamine-hydrolyzing) [Flavobacteriaceae bacterium]